jgi:hypothetical protein
MGQIVETLVEEAVQAFSTISLEILRWLRSPYVQKTGMKLLGSVQSASSQRHAARP